MKIVVNDDLFNISKRLKEIDDGYFVVFDTKKSRYEVRHEELNGRLCFVVPYKTLDCRTLQYALYTSVKNSKKLLKEIDKNNKEIEAKNYTKIMDECEYKFREIYSYEKGSKEMNLNNAYKTNWI